MNTWLIIGLCVTAMVMAIVVIVMVRVSSRSADNSGDPREPKVPGEPENLGVGTYALTASEITTGSWGISKDGSRASGNPPTIFRYVIPENITPISVHIVGAAHVDMDEPIIIPIVVLIDGKLTLMGFELKSGRSYIDYRLFLKEFPDAKEVLVRILAPTRGKMAVVTLDPLSASVLYEMTDGSPARHPTVCEDIHVQFVRYSSHYNPNNSIFYNLIFGNEQTRGTNLFDGDPTTVWRSKTGVYMPDGWAIGQPHTDLPSSGGGTWRGQWVTCRLPPNITVIGYRMHPRGHEVDDTMSQVRYQGHPRSWTLVASSDGKEWRAVDSQRRDFWREEMRFSLSLPVDDANWMGIVVHSVSDVHSTLSDPSFCAFNGLDFDCM